jgi:hypothetical protein
MSLSLFGMFPEALVEIMPGQTKKVYTDGDNLDYFGIDLRERQIDEIKNSAYHLSQPLTFKDLPSNIKKIDIWFR